jgi:hypothetical protein
MNLELNVVACQLKTNFELKLIQLEQLNDLNDLFGLAYECPKGDRNDDCPLKEIVGFLFKGISKNQSRYK